MNRLRIDRLFALLLAAAVVGCAGLPRQPEPPYVSLADLQILELGLFEQRYLVRLRLQNPNAYALPIAGMNYRLELNDQEFARGVSREAVTVPAHGEQTVGVEVSSDLGGLLNQLQALASGKAQSLRYRVSGDVSLLHRSLKLPFEERGEVTLSPPR